MKLPQNYRNLTEDEVVYEDGSGFVDIFKSEKFWMGALIVATLAGGSFAIYKVSQTQPEIEFIVDYNESIMSEVAASSSLGTNFSEFEGLIAGGKGKVSFIPDKGMGFVEFFD